MRLALALASLHAGCAAAALFSGQEEIELYSTFFDLNALSFDGYFNTEAFALAQSIENGGVGVFARRAVHVEEGEDEPVILSVDLEGGMPNFIRFDDVLDSPLGAVPELVQNVTVNGLFAAYLMVHERFARHSEWFLYLQMIRQASPAWQGDAFSRYAAVPQWLSGSSFPSVLAQREAAMRDEWSIVSAAIADNAALSSALDGVDPPSAVDFRRWLDIVFSRVHSLQFRSAGGAGGPSWSSKPILLPVADLLNFSPPALAPAHCFTTEDGRHYQCTLKRSVAAGEEVTVDYSRRELNNFQLLLDYGFASPDPSVAAAAVARLPALGEGAGDAGPRLALARRVFGEELQRVLRDGLWVERSSVQDPARLLASPAMAAARVFALSAGELEDAPRLRINGEMLVDVLRKGRAVSMRGELRALAMLDAAVEDALRPFGDVAAKAEALDRQLRLRRRLAAEHRACLRDAWSEVRTPGGGDPQGGGKGGGGGRGAEGPGAAVRASLGESVACQLKLGIEVEEGDAGDGTLRDGRWADRRLFEALLAAEEAAVLGELRESLAALRREIREQIDRHDAASGQADDEL